MYFQEGKSIRKISTELKINKRTVTKRIKEYEKIKSLSSEEIKTDPQRVTDYLKNGSTHNSSSRKPSVLTHDIIALIAGFLKSNEQKRLTGFRKQQLNKKDIHEQLVLAGHKIDYSTLCKYIRRQSQLKSERFIKQWYTEGAVCEFDWCEVNLLIADKKRRYFMATFTSAFSNYRFALLFERQDTLAFQESHNLFFQHIGGIYQQMVYDNMRVAVKAFVGRDEKEPTQALVSMASWYQFSWRFCNVRSGNEKGHVERSCEYVRRKSFGLIDQFPSFEEAQEHLLDSVEKINTIPPANSKASSLVRFDQEKSSLHPFHGILECYEGTNAKVDKYGTICCKNNHYSVPDTLTSQVVFVKLYASEIMISFNGKEVGRHTRSYGKSQWIIEIEHYLHTFSMKPGALAGSIALKQAPQWLKDIFEQYFVHCPRAFAELLLYCRERSISGDHLQKTIATLILHYPSSIDKDHIIALLGNNSSNTPQSDSSQGKSSLFDGIVSQSYSNLLELTAMMNYAPNSIS